MKTLVSVLTIASTLTLTHASESKIKCYAENAKAKSVVVTIHQGDKYSRLITASVDNGKKVFKNARAHSGGGGYNSVGSYYGRDYCANYEYEYESRGPWYNRFEEKVGFKCNHKSVEITMMEIVPDDTNEMHIESVRLEDYYSESNKLGHILFENCKKI